MSLRSQLRAEADAAWASYKRHKLADRCSMKQCDVRKKLYERYRTALRAYNTCARRQEQRRKGL